MPSQALTSDEQIVTEQLAAFGFFDVVPGVCDVGEDGIIILANPFASEAQYQDFLKKDLGRLPPWILDAETLADFYAAYVELQSLIAGLAAEGKTTAFMLRYQLARRTSGCTPPT